MRQSATFFVLLFVLFSTVAQAATPPCRPCAGIRVDDPSTIGEALRAAPAIEGEARLYVAWGANVDGSADARAFDAVRAAGGTPWLVLGYRTPAPILDNVETFDAELRDTARLARAAGERAHFQLAWPAGENAAPSEWAFLIKRAAVAITGAQPDARVIVGPIDGDPATLRALYAEDVAAYVDGVALRPAEPDTLAASLGLLSELDPGKPVVIDAHPWPTDARETLATAAADAQAGVSVSFFRTPAPDAAALAPLKILAREFQGDLSFDPYSVPTGGDGAWTFVRGSDLGLRVIARAIDGAQLTFDDGQLRRPEVIDLTSGESQPAFGQRRTAAGGLALPVDQGPIALLRLSRASAAELEGVEEELTVADERQLPVEEILRRLQAFEDDQARRLQTYRATNTMHLRFQIGSGIETIEASYAGTLFFERGKGFDWAWEDFYFNGVRWRGENPPEIPLVQPEKAAALPLEILFDQEYRYRLRGTEVVAGRDCWVIDFQPLTAVEPGKSLYQGTVWVDRQMYARVQTRALQLGLDGDVISNEETVTFTPVDDAGQPAPWAPSSLILPTRIVGKQLLSLLNSATQLELETLLTDLVPNPPTFASERQAMLDSETTMVRDTDKGLRYLVKGEDGTREVQENLDASRLFLAGGVFYDESVDFPIPLAGINYLSLDFRGTGNQLNVLFAGPLLTANYAEPRLFGSKWDAGVNLFGFFLSTADELYRDGREVVAEEVETSNASAAFFLGRPLGAYAKLDFTYAVNVNRFSESDDADPLFVVPEDTLTHSFATDFTYTRGGYRFQLAGSLNQRSDWAFWGLPGNTEFDQEQEDFTRWQVSLAKTWWLPKFTKLGIELEHLNGSDLDRFSKYDFGLFGDADVTGYQNGLVRASEADGIHLTYGLNLGDVFRVELIGDAVWATDEDTGLDRELLGGIGLEGTVMGPWKTIVNFEVGVPVAGPGDGVAARIVFLKLLGKNKNKNKG